MACSPLFFFFNKSNTIAMQYKVTIPLKSTLIKLSNLTPPFKHTHTHQMLLFSNQMTNTNIEFYYYARKDAWSAGL